MVGTVKFETRIKELVENLPDLAVLVEPLLIVRRVLREQFGILQHLLAIVRDDDVCRRLMTVPGVGPVVALTYRATVDVPARFRNSKAVGAVFGLTPSKYQSDENSRSGAISRCGDEMMRVMLYEAAQSMLLRSAKWSWLKAWAMKIARHRGMKKAIHMAAPTENDAAEVSAACTGRAVVISEIPSSSCAWALKASFAINCWATWRASA
jgi:transposase